MPIHDWTKVDAGLFHAFHQRWISSFSDALNGGVLPSDYFALAGIGDLSVATAPPRTRLVQRTESDIYAGIANRLTVRHRHGKVVAAIEIVSPGNKGSQASLRAFAEKSADFIHQGIHLLVIDLFPPTRRDPQGIYKVIWDEFEDQEFALPADKPLTLASYAAGPVKTAYVEPVAVGDVLPDMPLFLQSERYVHAPLEATYQMTWNVFPSTLKKLLQG